MTFSIADKFSRLGVIGRLQLTLLTGLLAAVAPVSAQHVGGGGGHGGGGGGGGFGGGGHGGGGFSGGGHSSGRGFGGGRGSDGGRGGFGRGDGGHDHGRGGYGRGRWGGGYYDSPPIVYGYPGYCSPALIYQPYYSDYCD